jgi:hypothetical protein
MDNVEKLRVLLQHWIDHNKGHVEEFEKWQKMMADEGQSHLAQHIANAVSIMAKVNDELDKALAEAGGPSEDEHHHHHHHHHHH